MAANKQLSDGNPDGTSLGQSSSDLISVYNVAPTAQQVAGTQVPVSAGAIVPGSTGGFGFANSAAGQAVLTSINEMRTALINFGILRSNA